MVQLERPPTAPRTVPRARVVTPASLTPWVVFAIAVVLGGGAAWLLGQSPFPPGGLGGDQSFRIAAIARDARQVLPVDFAYHGLPVFYPPTFFFVLGRLVAITGIPAYEALKFGVIAVAFLVPVIGYGLWRRLTGDAVIAAAVVVAGVALHDWYEPYSWIALVAFVPWWFAFVVHPDEFVRGATRGRVVVGSLVGGLIVTTYYYFFLIGAVQLGAVLGATWVARRRNLALPLRVTRESALVLAGSALVSAPYWAPLAFAAAAGNAESLPNRYFTPMMIPVPVPFLQPGVQGAVMLFGLMALFAGCRRSSLMLGLTTLLGAAYAWFVFGYVAVLADSPVLAYRTEVLIQAVLVTGAGIGAVHVVRSVTGSPWWARRRAMRRMLPAMLLLTAVVVLTASSLSAIPYLHDQRSAREPTRLLREFDHAMAGRVDGAVVLTAEPALIEFRPVYLFNVWNAHYSNPMADFSARSRFLDRLMRERDPAVVAAALHVNRYDRVDAVVLDAHRGALTYTDYQDNFPRGTRARTLHFTRAQFHRRWFEPTVTPARAIFVPRPVDPVDSLDASQLTELRRHFPGDLAPFEPAYSHGGSGSITRR